MKNFFVFLASLIIIPVSLAANQKFPSVSGKYFAIIKMNNKFGVIDKNGKILVPVEYDYDGYSPQGDYMVYRLMKDGKMGALFFKKNGTGRFVLPAFDGVKDCDEGLCGVKLGGKWGFIDENGKIVIGPQFEDIERFGNGVAPVKITDKYGIIDKRGKMVMAPKYDDLQFFVRGVSKAQNFADGKRFSAVVDTQGREILRVDNGRIGETFYDTFCIDNGRVGHDRCSAYAGMDGKIIISADKYPYVIQLARDRFAYVKGKGFWAITDRKLKVIKEVEVDSVWGTLFENLVAIRKNDKMGFMDVNGNIVTEPVFDCLGSGCPESMEEIYNAKKVIRAWKDGKVGLVNSSGKVVIRPEFDDVARDDDEGVIVYKKGAKYGLMDIRGKIRTGPEFDFIHYFRNGNAEASLNKKTCLLDTSGRVFDRPAEKSGYNRIQDSDAKKYGVILVEKDGLYGLIDKKGSVVVEIKYDSIYDFRDCRARVMMKTKDGFKNGYINMKGEEVIPVIYEDIFEMTEKYSLF